MGCLYEMTAKRYKTYVSKILSGHTNFSFKSIAEIEKCLNIQIMEASFA